MSCEETRKGYFFNNPDSEANDGWGALVTPDELRYVYMWGNDFVAPNGAVITDDTLREYVNMAVGWYERELNIDIYKKLRKYRPQYVAGVQQERSDLNGMEEGIDYFYEDPYDFNQKSWGNYVYIKLRKRPVLKIYKVLFKDPIGSLISDITTWMKPNYEVGSVQFFPHSGALANMPLFAGSPFFVSAPSVLEDFPDAFFIDYDSGFESADHLRKKFPELVRVVGMMASIYLMNEYGDGRMAAIASSSLGLDGLSESFSTTMSATNAMFGARIGEYLKEIKAFMPFARNKYGGGVLLGAL